MRSDGNVDDINITINPDTFSSRQFLLKYVVVLSSELTSKNVNIIVKANNVMGSVSSKSTLLTLADVP